MSYVSHNGNLLSCDELKLSFAPEGVFTTLRVHQGAVENIGKHLRRLNENCRILNVLPPEIPQGWIRDLIVKNQAEMGMWRLKIIIFTEGPKDLRLNQRSNVLISLEKYQLESSNLFQLAVYPFPVSLSVANVKSLCRISYLSIKDYAIKRGFNDALSSTSGGVLLETSCANILWVNNTCLYTPEDTLPLLKGTFLTSLAEGARKLGYRVIETRATLADIPTESNLFVCNSMIGLQAVDAIENRKFNRNSQIEEPLRLAALEEICLDTFHLR